MQKSFKKSPSVALEYLKEGDAATGKLMWALSAFESDKYLAKQSEDELEDFMVGVIRFVSKEPKYSKKSLLKESLSKVFALFFHSYAFLDQNWRKASHDSHHSIRSRAKGKERSFYQATDRFSICRRI